MTVVLADGMVMVVVLAMGLATVAPDQVWKASPVGGAFAAMVAGVPGSTAPDVAPLAKVPFTTVSVYVEAPPYEPGLELLGALTGTEIELL